MVDGGETTRRPGTVKPGAAWLSHRLGVEIVPVRVEFTAAGRARVTVLPPLPPPPRADRATLREATARLAALLA